MMHAGDVDIRESATDQQTQVEVLHVSQNLMSEDTKMMKKIELMLANKSKLLESLGSFSVEELNELGNQLQQSLLLIQMRKQRALSEQLTEPKEKFLFSLTKPRRGAFRRRMNHYIQSLREEACSCQMLQKLL
ncbi:hypothetical protein MUK42_37309 [Musa troglodytarum]|uniref:K-box domain-containing protein n=1 Tax=Musa troglodytarum TaxID=320322 RepID=A0A9E7GZX0_9LILI|nr:hypothetical protein MUK42_37309 [Musa troglodytarum]